MAIKDRKENLGVEYHRFHKLEGSAELSPKFPDYYNSAAATYDIAGGTNPRHVLFTMKIPDPPPYGSSILKKLDLYYYTDSITAGSAMNPISISAYKLKDTDHLNYDASKVTARKGLASGTAPTIFDTNTKSPLFFSATSCNHPLEFYSEDFNGADNTLSQNGEYVTLGRTVTAKIGPYMHPSDVAMFGQKSQSLEIELPVNWNASGDHGEMYGYKISWIKTSFGTIMAGREENEQTGQDMIVRLKSYNGNFWVTKDIHNGEDPLYVRKNHIIAYSDSKGRDFTTADLLYRTQHVLSDDGALYGDEVMPSNSVFTSVRADKELFQTDGGALADSTTTGAQKVVATSAVRYKKEGAKSGQLCNLISFQGDYATGPNLKMPALGDGVTNPMCEDNSEAQVYTDCVAAINNIPTPHPIGSPIPGLLKSVTGGYAASAHSGSAPTGNQQSHGGYAHPTIEMQFTIEEMAPAFEFDISGSHYISGTARTFTILFSNLPCATSNYRLRDYYDQITDTNNLDSSSLDYVVGGLCFWKNQDNKVQMTTVNKLNYSSTIKPTDFNHDYSFLVGTDVGNSTSTDDNTSFTIPENTPLKMTITWADPLIMNRAYVNIYTEVDDVLGMSEVCIASMETQFYGPTSGIAAGKNGLNDGGLPIGRGNSSDSRGKFAASNAAGGDLDSSSPHMSFWLSNTQESKAGSGNGEMDIQAVATEDMRSSVSIDNIAFLNYNNRISNSTVFRDADKTPATKHAYYSAAAIPENPLTYQNWMMTGDDIAGSDADWPGGALPKYGQIKAYDAAGAVTTLDIKGTVNNGKDDLYNYCSKGPGGTTFVWGFKNKNDLDDATRYSLMNGFACMNLHKNDDIDSALFTGGYTTPMVTSAANAVPLGGQCLPVNIDPDITPNAIRVGNNTTNDDIIIGSNVPNDVNNMTSGGWLQWNFSDSRAGPEGTTRSAWTARECVFASARVLRAERGSGATVAMQVDQLEVFRCESDQEYIVYQVGGNASETEYYATGIEVIGTNEANFVTLQWDGMADDGSTDMLENSTNELNNLMIGPKAFWIWMNFGNYKDSASGLSWNGPSATATATGWNNPNNLLGLPNKTYASMLLTSGQGTAGATYNEWCYSHDDGDIGAVNQTVKGAFQAKWNLNPAAEKDSLFDLEKDFGFGKFKIDDENDKGYSGGEVGKTSPNENNYSRLSMPKIIDSTDLVTGSFMSLFLKLSDTSDHSITIKSENASTKTWVDPASYEPFISATYFDMLPLPLEHFKFIPNEDDPWIPRLEWTVSDEDLWYGITHFDTEPVSHQYHKAILHFPLNEHSGAGGVLFRDDPSKLLKVYNYENGEISHQELGNFTGLSSLWHTKYMFMDKQNVLTDPHGLAGNATVFGSGRYSDSSTLNGSPNGNVLHRGVIAHPVGTSQAKSQDDDDANTGTTLPFTPTAPSDAFSLSMHVVPDSKPLAKYQLKGSGGTAMTFSVNHQSDTGSSQYWESGSAYKGGHKIKEALDASETQIDVDIITTFAPAYETGKIGTNKMQEDWGATFIAAGEAEYNGSSGDFDADGSIIIRVDDEFMKVLSVNPGTLTEATSGGTGLKADVNYYDGDEATPGFDFDSSDRTFRTNASVLHGTCNIASEDVVIIPGRNSQGYYTVETVKIGGVASSAAIGSDQTDDGTANTGAHQLLLWGGDAYSSAPSYGRNLDTDTGGNRHHNWIGHVDLTDITTTPSTNGEILLNNTLLESVTSIKCFDKDEDGDDLDDGENGVGQCLLTSDSSSFTNSNVATYGRVLRLVKKSDPSEANAVYYNVTSGGAKVGDVYDLTVEWIGGKKGLTTALLADEDDVLISNYGRNDQYPRDIKPVMVLGNKPYYVGGTINAVGGQSSPLPDTRPDYLNNVATMHKVTGRYIEVERGYGGTTATTHTSGTNIQRVSENTPVIGGISAVTELDDLNGDGGGISGITGPHGYDSNNQDQVWGGMLLDIANERFASPATMNADSSWNVSGWSRGIEATDWQVHDGSSVFVVPRHYLFHSYTGNSVMVNSLNSLQGTLNSGVNSTGKPIVSVFMDSDGKINVHAYIENQSYKTPLMIKSKAAIPTDGVTPTHIGVVFDKDLPSQNLKLFLNGKLEDSTGMRQATGGVGNLQDNADGQTGEPLLEGMGTVCIGGLPYCSNSVGYSYNSFDGIIEEVTIWARPVDFVNPETGTFDYTKPYHELEEGESTSSSSTLYGKMFIKDYHNIRGTSPEKVRASPTAVLRKSAFALDTS